MAATRVHHTFPHTLAFVSCFLYMFTLRFTKTSKSPLPAFSQAVVVQHNLLGEDAEVLQLKTSMKKFTFHAELPETITQFLASPSQHFSASEMGGQGSGNLLWCPGACTPAGRKPCSWGPGLGLPWLFSVLFATGTR